ncbi:MAG: flagellar biosynthetic protein FliR [candidate division Zixibacteria bacterium]|nr:flagellar biosynthetic protein FliR [candidate division Zixibacteria bacterium]MDH3936549.1 flagellar biosynthetic protein FliR [candidate division Zixibacteria bacterium]MDH4032288.1 flagellar biosynthetic protein FliR [candidate division Zixibacteria bacterium]
MFEFVNFGAEKLQFLLLIIVRTSGLFALAPVFGERGLPPLVRVGLVLMLSLVLVPTVSLETIEVAKSFWQLGGLVLHELFIGFLIGLLYRLLFMGTLTAGGIVGYQLGFAMVTVFDKNLASQISVVGRFWYTLAILIFLGINGHHLIISAFADSYMIIPPGVFNVAADFGDLIIKLTAFVFIVALKIAAPLMITLFLTDIALGTIAKTMPTMNVFFVGFPLKITIGLSVMAISLPVFGFVLERTTGYFDQQLQILLTGLGGT